jgi:hypothetical protein
VDAGEISKSLHKHMQTVTIRYAFTKSPNLANRCKQHQTATRQALDDPNKGGTVKDSMK